MGTAIIELNDSAIQCQHGEIAFTVPGYALLTGQGVVTGEEALNKAWLLPQQSHNQYWHQLSLSPLAATNRYARHHADLAYAQLQSLHRDAGKPTDIIFAVPGNFTNDQLSILLGLAKASPFNAAGLVDAAVATACHADISGEIIHIDIQLHTSVITRMECGAQVSRRHVTQYPDVSLKGFYDTWAHFIANKFISQYRYDPMHTAEGEQELRDRLPGWLQQLKSEQEIEIELSAQQGNFRLNILRVELLAANSQRWQRMAEALASATMKDGPADAILISHRVAALPGIEDYIDYSDSADSDAVMSACQTQARHIISDPDKLSFVTELPVFSEASITGPAPALAPIAKPTTSSKTAADNAASPGAAGAASLTPTPGSPPTHLLYRHQAHPLGGGVSISETLRGLDIAALTADYAAQPSQQTGQVLVKCQNQSVMLRTDQEKLPIKSNGNLDKLLPGDEIIIRGETLKFIEVL